MLDSSFQELDLIFQSLYVNDLVSHKQQYLRI